MNNLMLLKRYESIDIGVRQMCPREPLAHQELRIN